MVNSPVLVSGCCCAPLGNLAIDLGHRQSIKHKVYKLALDNILCDFKHIPYKRLAQLILCMLEWMLCRSGAHESSRVAPETRDIAICYENCLLFSTQRQNKPQAKCS